MTTYRTGKVVRYETADNEARTAAGLERHEDEIPASEQCASSPNELPSVALTTTFLALCQQYGSEHLAVKVVAAGRSAGVSELPQSNDWTTWDADEMRRAVEYLQRKRGMR